MVSVPFPNNGQNKNFKKDFNSENAGLVPPQNVQACLLYTSDAADE